MAFVLFIEAESDCSIVVDVTKIQLLREMPTRGLEGRIEIIFDQGQSVTVSGCLRDTWKAIEDARSKKSAAGAP
jgi:hypothetical protein